MKGCALLFFLTMSVLAIRCQTIIPGGYVSGTWESSQSPYHIQGNIEIHYDSTLVIEPGVEVLFDGSYLLTVHGLLDASALETDSIFFTAVDSITGWQGIEFYQINEELDSSNLRYCVISHVNKTSGNGGAIYIYQSNHISIQHCKITGNNVKYTGGIFMDEGNVSIQHCTIENNYSESSSGALGIINSVPLLYDLTIINNIGGSVGGIWILSNPEGSKPCLKQIYISDNWGGAIGGLALQYATDVFLDDCHISHNFGGSCGGIGLYDDSSLSDSVPENRNSVYLNKGYYANELYSYYSWENNQMYLDTFTVWDRDNYHVSPTYLFSFIGGVQHGLIEKVDTDLYLSLEGSDDNDGLSPEQALKTFNFALRKIEGEGNPSNTLWLLPGTYHLAEIESGSSINLKSNIKIAATEYGQVFLDGDSTTRIFTAFNKPSLSLSGLTIQNGNAHSGGGIMLSHSSAEVDSCTIIANNSHSDGGGICITNHYGPVHFTSCNFINNTCVDFGGGIYIAGSDTKFDYCNFIGNLGMFRGGGIYILGGTLNSINCRFDSNQTYHFGGGLCIDNTHNFNVVNCCFNGNHAGTYGGGLIIYSNSMEPESNYKLTNCTLSDNIASEGSALYTGGIPHLEAINSIFWDTGNEPVDLIHLYDNEGEDSTILIIDHCVVQEMETSIIIEGDRCKLQLGQGNLTIDPAFINPLEGDFSLNWNSPCIESGREDTTGLSLPSIDLNGNPRAVNARVDMGAYEYQLPVYIKPDRPYIPQINVYPLVASTTINIEFPSELENNKLYLRLFSLAGLEMKSFYKSGGNRKVQMDISELSAGLYLLMIMDSKGIVNTSKVIIAR